MGRFLGGTRHCTKPFDVVSLQVLEPLPAT